MFRGRLACRALRLPLLLLPDLLQLAAVLRQVHQIARVADKMSGLKVNGLHAEPSFSDLLLV